MGLIIHKQTDDGPRWLLICRRVSIGLIELLRGKYEVRDMSGIQSLIDQTTLEERTRLLTMPFDDLWRDLWNGPISRRYSVEFSQAKAKFELITSRDILREAIRVCTTSWTEPEWGFPKGRRSASETEIACALRETFEESGIQPSDLCVQTDVSPLIEEYRGSNGVIYRHHYWIAKASPDLAVGMFYTEQKREVRDVRWCTFDEAIARIRSYNIEKRRVLETAAAMTKEPLTKERDGVR